MEHMLCPLFERAQKTPDHPALITDHTIHSYAELNHRVQALCHALQTRGVQKQERVAFVAKSDLESVCLFFALFRLGAIACPLSHRTPPTQLSKDLKYLKASHFLDPHTIPLHSSTSPRTPPPS